MTTKPSPMFSDGAIPGENDIIIALMGMTGSGKSSLISLCTNQEVAIGHELESCTQEIETYVFHHPRLRSGRVYLVDTPGFDDTSRKDTEILRTLSTWLTATYSSGIKLSGIIYCHRINQTRMQGSALQNIKLFRSLCGDDAMSKVVLVTTMWDIENPDIAEKREKELKETAKYWGRMVAKGSHVLRHYHTQNSAFALIETFIKDDSKIVLGIQKEMVNDQRSLDKTAAGKDVNIILEEKNAELRNKIQNVESELREALKTKEEELAEEMKELRLEYKETLQQVLDSQQRLQATMQQLHESKFAEIEAKLEKERQKWRSQVSPQLPAGAYQASKTPVEDLSNKYKRPSRPAATVEEVSDDEYKPPGRMTTVEDSDDEHNRSVALTTSLSHLPGDFQMEMVWVATVKWGNVENLGGGFEISPDGSCLATTQGSVIVLLETDTGRKMEIYQVPEWDDWSPRPHTFSSDGLTLAILDNDGTFTAVRRGHVGAEEWFTVDEGIGSGWALTLSTLISKDFQTTVDTYEEQLGLTSRATETWRKLQWAGEISKPKASEFRFCFAKHDELLVCIGNRHVYFFSTATAKLISKQRVPGATLGSAALVRPRSSWVLSGDTLLLGVLVVDDAQETVFGSEIKFASFFRLSGQSPELISTFQYNVSTGSGGLYSLSCDGCYLAQVDHLMRELLVFHVMSGKEILRQRLGEKLGEFTRSCISLMGMRFFPCDNRLMFITSKGYYHIVRLMT